MFAHLPLFPGQLVSLVQFPFNCCEFVHETLAIGIHVVCDVCKPAVFYSGGHSDCQSHPTFCHLESPPSLGT